MSKPSTNSEKDLSALKTTVTTITALISQLQGTISSPPVPGKNHARNQTEIRALSLAHDASHLIKAHSTKLSLLLINAPFTPTAVITVLRELASSPLPALATAVELCPASQYTNIMRKELLYRVNKVYSELKTLVADIPLDGKALSANQKNGANGNRNGKVNGKGSLASTGVVWQACDQVMELKTEGVAGLLVTKAEQYRDTLKDALEELQEWAEEESDEDDDEDGSDDEDIAHEADHNPHSPSGPSALSSSNNDTSTSAAQAAIDNLFSSPRHIPTNDVSQLRPRLESSLRRLKLVVLLYSAIVKRRFKSLPPFPLPNHSRKPPQQNQPESATATESDDPASNNLPGTVQSLDEVMTVLRKIPHTTDELAHAFYELDSKEVDRRMDEVFFSAFAASELLMLGWDGKKDAFSDWASKFQSALKKGY